MSLKITFKLLTTFAKIPILYALPGCEMFFDACTSSIQRWAILLKLWGLIVHPIILGLKYNRNFLKGSFIPWRLFSGSRSLYWAIFWKRFSLGIKFFKGGFPVGVSYNFSTIFFKGRIFRGVIFPGGIFPRTGKSDLRKFLIWTQTQ